MREIDIAVVKIPKEKKDNEEFFKEKFAKLIDIAGGLDFVNKGDSVLIKVSLNSGRKYPATTSPEALNALIELLMKRSPSAIYVGDKSAFFRKTKKAFRNTGFEELIAGYDKKDAATKVRLIDFDDYVYRDRYFPKDVKDRWELQRTRHLVRAPKMLFEKPGLATLLRANRSQQKASCFCPYSATLPTFRHLPSASMLRQPVCSNRIREARSTARAALMS